MHSHHIRCNTVQLTTVTYCLLAIRCTYTLNRQLFFPVLKPEPNMLLNLPILFFPEFLKNAGPYPGGFERTPYFDGRIFIFSYRTQGNFDVKKS